MKKPVLMWAVRRIAQMMMRRRDGVGGYGRGASAYRGYAPSGSGQDARMDGVLAEASALLRTLNAHLDRLRDERRGPGDMRGDAVYRGRGGSDTRPL